jgi:NAD(P)-dependent dehydrogenase (short-subunit alcohol dehydrogenase family)
MRKQQSCRIVNLGSGAGIFGFPGGSAYVSSKYAVEGLSECISFELEPFGIKVILVEPGLINTNFGRAIVIAKRSKLIVLKK